MSAIDEKILKDAAEHIKKYGWQRNGFVGELAGPKCILGAIGYVTAEDPAAGYNIVDKSESLSAALQLAVGQEHYRGCMGVWNWNDRDASGQDEVLEVLKVAAVIARDL